jgi:DNA-binding response OmpR family regulator
VSKVLIVDDDATMLKLMSTLLPLVGFEVVVNPNPAAALETARSARPDVFLVDLHLGGGGSGLDVVRGLRADSQFATTPVIMISGEDREQDAREAGANVFLLKPFMPDQLISALKALVP